MPKRISEAMRVLARLRALEIDDFTDEELVEVLRLTRDCRHLRARATNLLHGRAWTRQDIGSAAEVDPVTTWRWENPTGRPPGKHSR